MNFKEWIYNELAGKNAYHRMVISHPGYKTMPKHVRDEFVNSAFGHSVNSSSQRAKLARDRGEKVSPMKPSEFLDNSPYNNRQWDKKAVLLHLTPADFDDKTLEIFVNRCFGYRPLPTIRDDAERMDRQRGILDPTSGNEPVIILQNGNKYKLQEGWHRTMTMLVWEGNPLGAPDDQIQFLKKMAQKLVAIDQPFIKQYGKELEGNSSAKLKWLQTALPEIRELMQALDFSKWKPVPIMAFIGKDGNSLDNFDYDATTADM